MALSDASLQPFLNDSFDAADYFNSSLPSLSVTSSRTGKASAPAGSATLADLSSQTQTLLSQLNAQTTRLSNTLTQLTDDILRTGGRLAYQVEVLRGETIGLNETLSERLQDDIKKFTSKGIPIAPEGQTGAVSGSDEAGSPKGSSPEEEEAAAHDGTGYDTSSASDSMLPPYIKQLRILSMVRARLESVIKVFGEAMQWTLPPSEVSLASSLISVSAPEPGSESHSREEKGREFAEKLRTEISEIITGNGETEESGYDAALVRIQALRDLAQVWRGTAEEKARIKFIESLVKLAEDRQRALENASISQKQRTAKQSQPKQTREKGLGFLENLQRMRGNIYLE